MPVGTVSLREAVTLALWHSPALQAFALELMAAQGRAVQAGLAPGLQLELGEEYEDTDRAGDITAEDRTVLFGHVVELGGKRAKRRRLADFQTDLARWDFEARRLDVHARVAQEFADVLTAQEVAQVRNELVTVAEQVLTIVTRRVEAGKMPALEETKARAALTTARAAQKTAVQALEVARRQLASEWGQEEPTFPSVEGRPALLSTLPPFEQLRAQLGQSPEIARWTDELKTRQATLAMERTKGLPDLILFGGVRYLSELHAQAPMVSVGLPLSLVDRQPSRILVATRDIARIRAEHRKAQTEATAALRTAYGELAAASAKATALRDEALPAARNALDDARRQCQAGQCNYLVMLDAERTWLEARLRYIEALGASHRAGVLVHRLIGQGIDTSASHGNGPRRVRLVEKQGAPEQERKAN
jgi:cobalt-zinc-cadmium efflux system outer membrane protein